MMNTENNPQNSQQDTQTIPFPKSFSWKRLWPALAAMAVGLAMIPVASPVRIANLWLLKQLSIRSLLDAAQQWPSTWAIIALSLTIIILDRKRRHTVSVLVIALLLAGGANSVIKISTGRARPQYGLQMEWDEFQWTKKYKEKYPESRMRIEPYDQWMLFSPQRPFMNSNFWSFPSGHTNTAFAMAAYLSAMYPQGKALWITMGAFTALSRTHNKRHYLEDTFFGGGLGWVTAQITFAFRWPLRLGLAIENILILFYRRLRLSLAALRRKTFPSS